VCIAGLLNAVSMHIFIHPSKLVPGGVSGLASLLMYLPTGMSFGVWYFILNAPLLIWALITVRGDFTFKTIAATATCIISSEFLPVELVFTESPLIAVVFGGITIGISMYLASIYNGSNGGTEVIAKIIAKKRPEYNLSSLIFTFNLMVLVIGSVVLMSIGEANFLTPVISYIYVLMGGKVMGLLMRGLDRPQKFSIVTKRHAALSRAILKTFRRGVTVVDTVDSKLADREYKLLYVICQHRQASKLKRLIKRYDPDAFAFAKDVFDVLTRPTFNRSYNHDKSRAN
jgi:uncharacterized membrane-anchored protein YitT (DUF2179 family)